MNGNGKSFDDAKPPHFTIEITQADIDGAVVRDSGHCIFADGIKRFLTDKKHMNIAGVSVDVQTIRFTDREKRQRYVYLTPRAVQVALVQYDQGIKPEPFIFRLGRVGAQIIALRERTPSDYAREAKQREAKRRRVARVRAVRTTSHQTVISKLGGKAPPTAVLAGNRRQFGLRALGRIPGISAAA